MTNNSSGARFQPGLISVVIPCRNEQRYIAACVESIFASDYSNVEVLVVDGMSDDGTREVLQSLKSRFANFKVVDNPQKVTPAAFNLGIKNSNGEFVQIVGSRNVLDKKYLSTLLSALKSDANLGCVGGDCQHVYENEEARFISLAMESKFGVGGGNFRTMKSDAFVDTVGVPMFPRQIFESIGYFDEALTRNQDDDLSFRLHQAGYKIKYVHSAQVTYLVRSSLVKTFRQYFQYGYWKVFVSRKHRQITTIRQLVPCLFVAFLIAGAPLSLISAPVAASFISILCLYLVLGFLFAEVQGFRPIERLKVMRATFVLHLSYGLGYWQGIWDFLIFRRTPRGSLQRQTV